MNETTIFCNFTNLSANIRILFHGISTVTSHYPSELDGRYSNNVQYIYFYKLFYARYFLCLLDVFSVALSNDCARRILFLNTQNAEHKCQIVQVVTKFFIRSMKILTDKECDKFLSQLIL